MELDELTLVGYHPLLLNDINEITYTPDSPYQLILGTNGSGKSSLMSQLSMLPAVPADYIEGGSKTWKGRHEHREFKLISKIGKKVAKHEFWVRDLPDGEWVNLNDGGTGLVQKTLVEQYSKLDNDLHDVLLGRRVRFTDMSPAKRKEWFQRLNPVSVEFGVNLHKDTLSRIREIGVLQKHLLNEVGEASKSLLSDEAYALLSEESENVKATLYQYMEMKYPEERYKEIPYARIEQLSERILSVPLESLPSGDVDSQLETAKQTVNYLEGDYRRLLDEFYVVDAELKQLGELNPEEISIYQKKADWLKSRLDEFQPIQRVVNDDDADMAYRILHSRLGEIGEVTLTIPVKQDDFTSERLEWYSSALERATKDFAKLHEQILHLQTECRRIDSTGTVQCPKCATEFKPGIDKGAREQIMDRLTTLTVERDRCKERSEQYQERIAEITTWRNAIVQLGRLLGDSVLTPYRQLIMNSTMLYETPMLVAPHIRTEWVGTLSLQREYVALEKEHREVLTSLEMAIAADNAAKKQHRSSLTKRHTDIETALFSKRREIELAKQGLMDAMAMKKRSVELVEWRGQLSALLDDAQEQEVSNSKAEVNASLNELIGAAQTQLALLENRKSLADTTRLQIARAKENLQIFATELEDLMVLERILSPREGLVAEQLAGSNDAICEMMNAYISRVWTYDLRILACGIESDELDYVFPLQVRDSKPVKDINMGSDSQQGIVNLAFRLTVSVFLALQGYPLYLDEIAREFDEAHGARTMQFIKQMVESGEVSQIFLISHNPLLHSVFTTADVNILKSENISLPIEYNKCLVIV